MARGGFARYVWRRQCNAAHSAVKWRRMACVEGMPDWRERARQLSARNRRRIYNRNKVISKKQKNGAANKN